MSSDLARVGELRVGDWSLRSVGKVRVGLCEVFVSLQCSKLISRRWCDLNFNRDVGVI